MSATPTILLNEKELFIRISKDDQLAFTEVFYHYTSRIHPFIQKMVLSEEITEEIVQEVFFSLWKSRDKLPEIENCAAYIFKIATNKTFNHLKRKAREFKRSQDLFYGQKDSTNNTTETIDLRESRDLINRLVERLTPQKKLIYKLTREEGLSHDEIAKRLCISKNTIKNHLVETLKYLRKNLQKSHGFSIFILSVFIEIYSS